MFLNMDETETFRENLLRMMAEKGLTEAGLSRQAGLNARAVTDIRERRVASPKLSTIFALAKALKVDPGELMGLGKRHQINSALAEYLQQFGEAEQAQLLAALAALPRKPA